MHTLFLDTHDKLITISFIEEKDVYTKTIESESHSSNILPLLNKMLEEKHINIKYFNNIVVINGPGSFTGVRIGLTIAKTIAFCQNIPIYTISSLKSYLISSEKKENIISVIEDPKGFYVGNFNEEVYTSSLDKYKNNIIIENKLDILKIVDYCLKTEPINPHGVRANYVKVIEVLK